MMLHHPQILEGVLKPTGIPIKDNPITKVKKLPLILYGHLILQPPFKFCQLPQQRPLYQKDPVQNHPLCLVIMFLQTPPRKSGKVPQSLFDFHDLDTFEDDRPAVGQFVPHFGVSDVASWLDLDCAPWQQNHRSIMYLSFQCILSGNMGFWFVPFLMMLTLIT